jgi:hypothetical protein
MASNVEIVNSALTELGQDRVSSLSQSTEAARVAAEVFEAERDQLLQEYPWSFAAKRTALPLLSTSPAFGYANEFQLPTDFLHLLEVHPDMVHEVEGQTLRCDADEVWIKYVRRVADPNEMSPLFRGALAARVAAKIATKITSLSGIKDRLETLYRERLKLARARDAQGRGNPRPIRPATLLDSRR